MRRFIIFVLALLSPSLALAQSTTLSGNVTDLGGQVWSNGTVVATFVNPHGTGNSPFTWTGGFFNPNLAIIASINSGGNYTFSIPSNTAIIPSNSQWTLTANSGTTGLSTQTITLTISGATQSVNFTPPALIVTASSMSVAYNDGEVSAQTGQFYYNLTLAQPRVCQASTGAVCSLWAGMGSGGGGSGTVTHTLGNLNSGQIIIGNAAADIKVGDLIGDVITAGTTTTSVAKIQGTTVTLTSPSNGQVLAINSGAVTNLFPGISGRVVSGTSDTVATTDRATTVQFTAAASVAETLPSAGTLGSNFPYVPYQTGTGNVTITPGSGTINGLGSITLTQNTYCAVSSPDNSNYLARCANWVKAGTNITAVFNSDGSTTFNATGGGGGSVFPVTVSGTVNSGGIPYFNSTTQESSSALLTANLPVFGGGAGAAPFSGTITGNTTLLASASGAFTSTHGVKIDANGNLVDTGANYIPTLDVILNPLNSVTHTFLATQGWVITGTTPASAGTGTNAGVLFTITTPNGGAGSTTTGGNGGDITGNLGSGGSTTAGLRARAGSFSVNCGTDGIGGTNFGTGQGEAGCLQVVVTANQGSSSFPFGLGVAGNSDLFARNTASTSGNTVNNWSPPIAMSAHMQLGGTATVTNGSPNVAQATGAFFGMTLPGRTITLGGVNYTVSSITNNFNLVLTSNYTASTGTVNFIEDAVVTAGMVLYPGFPTSSIMSVQNTANPEISWIFQIPSLNNASPYFNFVFMQGGPTLTTNNGGGSVGGDGWLWNPGGRLIIGMDPFGTRASSPVFFGTNAGSSMDIYKCFRASGGCTLGTGITKAAACEGTDNAANGSWVYCQMMTNSSGATINDGSPVKMTTANQVTPTTTTDTGANIVLGVNVGACLSGAVCQVAWGGRLLGVMILGTGTCAVGNAIIVDTTTNQRIKCIAAGSATFGTVIGMAESVQNSVGSTVDVSLRIH